MKKVEHQRAEKMRKKECFTSLQPCDRQSEQNDTDEPPSLFLPLNAGTGLNRLFATPFRPALIAQDLQVFFLSKNRLSQKSKTLPFPANGCIRELSTSADDCFETEGFIITPINGTLFSTPLRGRKAQKIISNLLIDKRGRIKTIIFKQKRSM